MYPIQSLDQHNGASHLTRLTRLAMEGSKILWLPCSLSRNSNHKSCILL